MNNLENSLVSGRVAENAHRQALTGLPQQVYEGGLFAVLVKNFTAPVAAVEHMVTIAACGPSGSWYLVMLLQFDPPCQQKSRMSMPNRYAPGTLVDNEDGSYSLVFSDFAATEEAFEDYGQEGGGYGWHAVVDAWYG